MNRNDFKYEDGVKLHNQQKQEDIMTCNKCGGTYFKLEIYSAYLRDQPIGYGQKPPKSLRIPEFYLLRCPCGELYEPTISMAPGDPAVKYYQGFLKYIESLDK